MKPRHAAFAALDPFFELVQRGLSGLVDGEHYFDTIAENTIFEIRYDFPGWPQRIEGRDALMAHYLGYGDSQGITRVSLPPRGVIATAFILRLPFPRPLRDLRHPAISGMVMHYTMCVDSLETPLEIHTSVRKLPVARNEARKGHGNGII